MRRRSDDAAASDLLANILLVAVAVALCAIVATVVAANLSRVPPGPSSLSLAPVQAGDASARVAFLDGSPVPAADLNVLVGRNGNATSLLPRANWTASAATLSPGASLVVNLTPALAPGDAVRIVVSRSDQNLIVLDATTVAPRETASLPPATLAVSLSPASIPADGATPAILTARIANPAGAVSVAAVRADVSALQGGASVLPLHDDGVAPDAEGGDGNWSASLLAIPGTPQVVYPIALTAYDAAGLPLGNATTAVNVTAIALTSYIQGSFSGNFSGNVTGNFSGNLKGAVIGGSAASLGSRFAVPDSGNISMLKIRNWSYDTAHPLRMQNDAIVVRIIGQGNQQWSAYIRFSLCPNNVPCITQMETWGPLNDTIYVPRNATLPLPGLELDLLNPVGSLQMVRSSGANDPTALYPPSGVFFNPTFFVAFLGDEQNTGSISPAQNNGLYSFDVGFA